MNRNDFQQIAEIRLREADALLHAGMANGAYYLAGYAVECALKACIAKRTSEHDFPEREARDYYSHDLEKLLGFARLRDALQLAFQADLSMEKRWTIVLGWSEASRYVRNRTAEEAIELLAAIEDSTGGVLPWLRKLW